MLEGVGAPAKGRIRLDVDTLDPSSIGELIDVVGRQLQLNGLVDIAQRQAHGLRLHPIHRELQLRRFRQRVGAGTGEQRTLARLIDQSLLRRGELRPRLARARL